MMNIGNLGVAALLSGDSDTASHAFREELTLSRDMVVRSVVLEGEDKRPATLIGAADAHRHDKAAGRRQAR